MVSLLLLSILIKGSLSLSIYLLDVMSRFFIILLVSQKSLKTINDLMIRLSNLSFFATRKQFQSLHKWLMNASAGSTLPSQRPWRSHLSQTKPISLSRTFSTLHNSVKKRSCQTVILRLYYHDRSSASTNKSPTRTTTIFLSSWRQTIVTRLS